MEIHFDADVTAIEIHTGQLFEPGGLVHRWAAGISREVETWAHAFVPPHTSEARWGTWATGKLEASLYRQLTEGAGNTINIEVGASAPHARFVHEGTAHEMGYIYTTAGYANMAIVDSWIENRQLRGSADDRGFWMPVTRIPGRTQYHLRVRGQKANPFLIKAYNRAARGHQSLHPM